MNFCPLSIFLSLPEEKHSSPDQCPPFQSWHFPWLSVHQISEEEMASSTHRRMSPMHKMWNLGELLELSASCPLSLLVSASSQSAYSLDRKWLSLIDNSPWTDPTPRASPVSPPYCDLFLIQLLEGWWSNQSKKSQGLLGCATAPEDKTSNVLIPHQSMLSWPIPVIAVEKKNSNKRHT